MFCGPCCWRLPSTYEYGYRVVLISLTCSAQACATAILSGLLQQEPLVIDLIDSFRYLKRYYSNTLVIDLVFIYARFSETRWILSDDVNGTVPL